MISDGAGHPSHRVINKNVAAYYGPVWPGKAALLAAQYGYLQLLS